MTKPTTDLQCGAFIKLYFQSAGISQILGLTCHKGKLHQNDHYDYDFFENIEILTAMCYVQNFVIMKAVHVKGGFTNQWRSQNAEKVTQIKGR